MPPEAPTVGAGGKPANPVTSRCASAAATTHAR